MRQPRARAIVYLGTNSTSPIETSIMRTHLLTVLLTTATLVQANVTVYVFAHSICGRPSGIVQASMQGGVPPYTYAWSNGATDAYVEGLLPGIYSVTVTDALNDQYMAQGEVLAQTSYGIVSSSPDEMMHCAGGAAMSWVYLGMDQLGVNPPITSPTYGPAPILLHKFRSLEFV